MNFLARLLLAVLLLWAAPASAAIVLQGSADLGDNGGTTNSLSHAYTASSGANRLLIVVIDGDTDAVSGGTDHDDITSVTYNSVSMTLAAKLINNTASTAPVGNQAFRYLYVYFLLNPASGSNTVSISSTNNHFLLAVAADYTGVAQSGQPTATDNAGIVFNNVTSQTESFTVPDANSLVVSGYHAEGSSGSGPGAGTNLTFVIQGANFNQPVIADNVSASSGASNYQVTMTANSDIIGQVLASFAPVTCPQTLTTLGVGC